MAALGEARNGIVGDPRFADAYRALRSDPSVQFDLARAPPRAKLPGWVEALGRWVDRALQPVGRLVRWIGGLMPEAPYARILLWTLLAVLAAALVWVIVERVRSGHWRLPRRRRVPDEAAAETQWLAEPQARRAWLQEAEALAAAGDYAEAIHHLLRRSVEDIARRHPRLIAPALTSRDIAANRHIPPGARAIFATIARLVERSLFGGRAVDAADWTACRTAYADLAQRATWAA